MNFLPVVTRELRVASRRRATYWTRGLVALVAIGLSVFFFLIFALNPSSGGQAMFVTLSYYAFGLCAIGGAFITADSLSEEKREGTLGLLFLTDLSGYDVVLGKFAAMSLNAIYSLIAIVPILAIPLLFGGVTGGEFWRVTLALLNALFFSLALGICVSANSRDAQRAVGKTLMLLVFFAVLLPLLEAVPGVNKLVFRFAPITSISPYAPFHYAFEGRFATSPGIYKSALLSSNLLSWGFIALASLMLPRTWQDRPESSGFRSKVQKLTSGGRVTEPRERAKLLSINPVLWLMSGGRQLRGVTWLLVAATVITCLAVVHFGPDGMRVIGAWMALPFLFLLKLTLAVRASAFYAESRKSGALEMLLATPLNNQDILHGQWLALRRTFQWPVIVIVLALLYPVVFQIMLSVAKVDELPQGIIASMMSVYVVLKFLADIFAVVWFGMWMGLSSKKPSKATGWTVLVAVIAPTLLTPCCYADLALDLFLIFFSKGKLELDLRRYLTGDMTRPPLLTIPNNV